MGKFMEGVAQGAGAAIGLTVTTIGLGYLASKLLPEMDGSEEFVRKVTGLDPTDPKLNWIPFRHKDEA